MVNPGTGTLTSVDRKEAAEYLLDINTGNANEITERVAAKILEIDPELKAHMQMIKAIARDITYGFIPKSIQRKLNSIRCWNYPSYHPNHF